MSLLMEIFSELLLCVIVLQFTNNEKGVIYIFL